MAWVSEGRGASKLTRFQINTKSVKANINVNAWWGGGRSGFGGAGGGGGAVYLRHISS